jgi:hypothetical protein
MALLESRIRATPVVIESIVDVWGDEDRKRVG